MPTAHQAIVILGCRVGSGGEVRGALQRRVETGFEAFASGVADRVVVSGGKRWGGVAEAQAMSRELVKRGVPHTAILEELGSHSTWQNARFTGKLLLKRLSPAGDPAEAVAEPELPIALVTCDFHMPRASLLFREHGFRVWEIPAPSASSLRARLSLAVSERVKRRLDTLALTAARVRGGGAGGGRR